jgi:tetratricopeptide (TPR) repeat protein
VFAPAWAGLADTFTVLGGYLLLQPEDAYPRARAAAEKALALDDGLAEAHASLATVLADFYWNWREAGQHYRKALSLNPSYATARLWYAGFLRDLGQFDEALAQARAARDLDPLSLPTQAAEGITLYVARRYPEAVAVYRNLLEITPTFTYAHFLLALALTQEQDYTDALASLQEAEKWGGAVGSVRGLSGYIHAALGHDDEARRLLEALEHSGSADQPTWFQRAVIHVALGETGPALDLLEQALDRRDKQLRLLRIEPLLDPIRSEPRFHALLERVGLTDESVARALEP